LYIPIKSIFQSTHIDGYAYFQIALYFPRHNVQRRSQNEVQLCCSGYVVSFHPLQNKYDNSNQHVRSAFSHTILQSTNHPSSILSNDSVRFPSLFFQPHAIVVFQCLDGNNQGEQLHAKSCPLILPPLNK